MVGPNVGQPVPVPGGAAGTTPGGAAGVPDAIPDIRKPDIQLLMQDLAQSRREVFETRREIDRRVTEERDRSRWEQEKIRKELSDKLRDAERENNALITALGRLRGENDALREENAVLKISRFNGHVEARPESKPETETKVPPVSTIPSTSLFKKLDVPMVPTAEPALGKPVAIDPMKRA